MKFSILIPTWNNLPYLQLCIRSIRLHSNYEHQIIVIINEGKDGTLEWVQSQPDITYLHASENIGICKGLNQGRSLATNDYLLYMNDDMYALPNWDTYLVNEVNTIGHTQFMLSATMIEPYDTKNPCVIVSFFGDTVDNFEEEKLLKSFDKLQKEDWNGSTWPPNLMHVSLWDKVGGMSEAFSPGMYSDPDLSMKCWQEGVRYFKGLGKSQVYHFGSRSTKRLGKNIGRQIFKSKWGLSSSTFSHKYLRRGEPWFGPLPEANLNLIDHVKSIFISILS